MFSVCSLLLRPLWRAPVQVPASLFSKYLSKAKTKRIPLSTKKVGGSFYKGNRCRKEGKLTSKGKFILNKEMCTELVVPSDLKTFTLKAYVGVGAKRNVI